MPGRRRRRLAHEPTALTVAAATSARANAAAVMARWTAIKTVDVPALNLQLKAAGLPAIAVK